jgi:Ca2+-binding EF-hand superfamily protein
MTMDYEGMVVEDLNIMFDTIDIDKSGDISFSEFNTWFQFITRTVTATPRTRSVKRSISYISSSSVSMGKSMSMNETSSLDTNCDNLMSV